MRFNSIKASYPVLKNSALKNLEKRYLYNFKYDQLYELDAESFDFISYFTGANMLEQILKETNANMEEAKQVIHYLLEENCIELEKNVSERENKKIEAKKSFTPSLRYLQLHITEKCNLNCRHCYLGNKGKEELDLKTAKKVIADFSEHGLKLLITGGEPMMHAHFWEILKFAGRQKIRVVVLTNGSFLSYENAEKLSNLAHEVQISLDGLKESHEHIRGKGSFEKAINAIKNAKKTKLKVSIATMIHAKNLEEFDKIEKLVKELKADEWLLDIPSLIGNAEKNSYIIPELEKAVKVFKEYGFSSGMHEGSFNYACGSHLCSVLPSGDVTKCGFFEESVGSVKEQSIKELWKKVVKNYLPSIYELACRDCDFVEQCRGGCRYRALREGSFYAKDRFSCLLYYNYK